MIAYLSGALVAALPNQVTVDVNGIGYLVSIPVSTFDRLPEVGQKVVILTHLVVREDAHLLYGFLTLEERDLFKLLVTHVSGVGPKTAMDVLSGSSVNSFKACVVASDAASLSKIKGIGKKTAERIILELKDKVGVAAAWEAAAAPSGPKESREAADAVLALISLGYKQADAKKAVQAVQSKVPEGSDTGALVSAALRTLL